MYEAKHHRMSGRIVSISQPHIRPIVRGKAGTPVEFGMKISSANIDGYLFIDRCSWDPYNESGDLVMQAEKYKQRYGVYPESIHADQIYRTRDNRTWCTERGIRLSGPPLGRPPKDPVDNRERKKLARQDELDRIAVEGTFGRAKRRYSMGRLMTKLAQTSETQVAVIMLVMKLGKDSEESFLRFHPGHDCWAKNSEVSFPRGDWGIVKWQHRVFSGGPKYRPPPEGFRLRL
jgi:IS5 family transposase